MTAISSKLSTGKNDLSLLFKKLWAPFSLTPMLSWLCGALIAVLLEQTVGLYVAWTLGLPKIPVLFGVLIMLETPILFPSAVLYVLIIYILPVALIAWLTTSLANNLAGRLLDLQSWLAVLVHLALFYAVLHLWAEINDYRVLVVRLTLISIILTLSLNVVNGYMGEFSCSHPGFMALGAYGASVFTLALFTDDRTFGAPLLPAQLGVLMFPLSLIFGGVLAALGALIIAIPSFRTRGDYLAIISLAFMFIVKSLIENLDFVGGPRGLGGQPDWANLPTVFAWTAICIWITNNFVRSTLGKALNAVRDDETAADAMTVNTRQTKMVAFLFAAFWAGVAGGLFAHVLRYVNPGSFGLQKLAEILAMLYFGGLNSVVGSIVGAVSFNLVSEALRPLEIMKWIIIPVIFILVMIFRPTGLIAFTEFNVVNWIRPKNRIAE
ncbi:MAG: branched-chain amino acid ABC transporter permease [Anaerolineales bacterium]|nr:branched-chain amino acid ABC transporter permease [Anaerolineales bacterium]